MPTGILSLRDHRRIWADRPTPPGRRGGDERHSLHRAASRICTLPPRLANHLVSHYTRLGATVLDPFCGKGTVPLEACLLGRRGIGVDASPEAVTVTRATVRAPSLREVEEFIVSAAKEVQMAQRDQNIMAVSADVSQFFHPETLSELLAWRQVLRGKRSDAAGCVRGLLLGILHGKGSTFLSLRCSHAYSMSPTYVREYVRTHGLKADYRNVAQCLLRRARQVLADGPVPVRGRAWQASATRLPLPDRVASLILTSPPYFSVHKYARENWLRLWFLGFEDYRQVQRNLIQTADVERYRKDMGKVLGEMWRVLRPGGRAIILVGDVTRETRRVTETIRTADIFASEAKSAGFDCEAILEDDIPQHLKIVGYMAPDAGIRKERLVILRKE